MQFGATRGNPGSIGASVPETGSWLADQQQRVARLERQLGSIHRAMGMLRVTHESFTPSRGLGDPKLAALPGVEHTRIFHELGEMRERLGELAVSLGAELDEHRTDIHNALAVLPEEEAS